jgi:hypothetical protein
VSRPYNPSHESPQQMRKMTQIDIADENLAKLLKIQHVINTEEGLESNLDEALARVLEFYRRFVPYA